jgi:hypothetical protein
MALYGFDMMEVLGTQRCFHGAFFWKCVLMAFISPVHPAMTIPELLRSITSSKGHELVSLGQ